MTEKQMKTFFLKCFFFFLACGILVITLGSCHANETEEHTFDVQLPNEEYLCSAATCTKAATYYFSCTCGERGSQTFSVGVALGHSFGEYISNQNADCTHDGTQTAVCARCGQKDIRVDEGTKMPHTFETYAFINETYHEMFCHCGWFEIENHHFVVQTKEKATLDVSGSYELLCSDCGYCWCVQTSNLETKGYTFYQYFEIVTKETIFLPSDILGNYLLAYEVMPESQKFQEIGLSDESTNLALWQRYWITEGQIDEGRYAWVDGSSFVTKMTQVQDHSLTFEFVPCSRYYQLFVYDLVDDKYYVFQPAKRQKDGVLGFYDVMNDSFIELFEKVYEGPELVSLSNLEYIDALPFNGDSYVRLDLVSFEEIRVQLSWLATGIEQKQGFTDLPWILSSQGQLGLGEVLTQETVSESDELALIRTSEGVCFLVNGKEIVTLTRSADSLGFFILGHLPGETLGGSVGFLKTVSVTELGGEEVVLLPCRLASGRLGMVSGTDGSFYPLLEQDYSSYMNQPINRNDEVYRDAYFVQQTVEQLPNGNDWCGLSSSPQSLVCQYDAAAFASYLSMEAYSPQELAKLLPQYGFTVLEQNYSESGGDTICYTFAKKATLINEKLSFLYLVILRGTGDSEWASNFNIGNYVNGFHDGFSGAADYAIKALKPYLSTNTEENYVLITGHSRGAAVGSIIASNLMESGLVHQTQLTAYVFACPTYSMRSVSYENIFVFNNPGDVVPELPLKKWGFHVEGQTILLPTNASGMSKLNAELIANSSVYGSMYASGYTGMTDSSTLIKLLNAIFPNVSIIHEIDINEFINQMSPLLNGGTLSYNAISTIISLFFSGGNYLTKLALIGYVQTNQEKFSPSHQMGVYRAWITTMR